MKAFQGFDPNTLIQFINLLKEMRYFPARVNLYEIDLLVALYEKGTETLMDIGDPFVDDMMIPNQHPFDTLQKICEEPVLMETVLWYNWSEIRFKYMVDIEHDFFDMMVIGTLKKWTAIEKTYDEFINSFEVKEINGVITNMEIHILYNLNKECAENSNNESVKRYCHAKANYWLEILKTEGYNEHLLALAQLCAQV